MLIILKIFTTDPAIMNYSNAIETKICAYFLLTEKLF
jgi:hypothetical protein